MAALGCFVTGTDTGIGKTWVSAALMEHFKSRGQRVAGMKPVASGCDLRDGALRSEDALLLQAHASFPVAYDEVNPYAFAPPIAPHIAAALASRPIRLEAIERRFRALADGADWVVVEGVGGWAVPLNEIESVSDIPATLDLPVVLVVGIKLGCLNHAILTHDAIERSGCFCAGWVANRSGPDCPYAAESIRTLEARLDAPLLGVLPHLEGADFSRLAGHIDGDRLLDRIAMARSAAQKSIVS